MGEISRQMCGGRGSASGSVMSIAARAVENFPISGDRLEPAQIVALACLALAYAAGERGGLAPAYLNAADEVAVSAFLEGRIAFDAIPELHWRFGYAFAILLMVAVAAALFAVFKRRSWI